MDDKPNNWGDILQDLDDKVLGDILQDLDDKVLGENEIFHG